MGHQARGDRGLSHEQRDSKPEHVFINRTLPKKERYSYVYQGNTQVLDQVLTSPAIRGFDYDSVHINAEFANQTSDHDPQIIRFHP